MISCPAAAMQDVDCFRAAGAVLRHFSLTVSCGSMVWLAGSNGSGKSTLLQLVAGVLTADKGTVQRYVPCCWLADRPPLKEMLTCRAHLETWQSLHGVATGVLEALDAWGLPDKADVPVRLLSFGQRQRLHLCRLLFAPSPALWLLDEPLTGLDVYWQGVLLEQLSGHVRQGGSALVASHHLPELAVPVQTVTLDGKVETLPAGEAWMAQW